MSAQPTKDPLRDQVVALRQREREIRDELAALTSELEHNETEQRRLKHLLVTDTQTHVRLPTSTPRSARRVLYEMGSFTISFAAKRLGWTEKQLKELVKIMECEKPPALERTGKYGGQVVFAYTGPAIDDDPSAERAAAQYEALRQWALMQTTTFTPAQGAAVCETKKSVALQAFRLMQEAGTLEDRGPTQDMPIFAVVGLDAPELLPPKLTVVQDDEPKVWSKIPQVQELLEACDKGDLAISETDKHWAVENLDGTRVVFDKKPQNREAMLQLRGRLRRMGAKL